MELIRVCCVCNKTEDNGRWGNFPHHTEDKIRDRGTHGFCDPCYEDKMHEINHELHTRKTKPNHKYDI